ncbi:MAG: hypothetical protein ACE37H_02145 [Phycisphaeraceae bacterium]
MSDTPSCIALGATQTSPTGRWLALAVIVLATLVGGGVRFADLGGGGVWFDELYTVRDLSNQNTGYSPTRWLGYQPTKLGLLAQGISAEDIPGRSYWAYQDAGVTMGKARLAACFIGVITIPLLAWGAWRPLGPGAAAVLAVLVALCVWNVSWSQTARFYTQVGLFGGLAVLFYLDAIKTGSRWRFAASTVMVVLAYLTHPPAILIGSAMLCDALLQLARRRPLNYGRWGWGWGLGAIAVCVAVQGYEMLSDKRFRAFAGDEAEVYAQGAPEQSLPMIFVYVFVMLTPALIAAALIGFGLGRRHRAVWVLAFAALVPVLAVAALSVVGGAHGRYAYVSMVGWVGLAAVGLWFMANAMRERFGGLLSWSPAFVLGVAMLPALGSYLTTGHRFIEPFHVALRAVEQRVGPGDVVFAERREIAQYQLKREDVLPLPGRLSAMDEQAAGRPAWVFRLSANSRGRRDWGPAKDERMQLVFRDATAVWLPRREVSAYRLSPSVAPVNEVQEEGGSR